MRDGVCKNLHAVSKHIFVEYTFQMLTHTKNKI